MGLGQEFGVNLVVVDAQARFLGRSGGAASLKTMLVRVYTSDELDRITGELIHVNGGAYLA